VAVVKMLPARNWIRLPNFRLSSDVDARSAKLAATLKAKLGLPYADCFAAALASLRRAAVVTADRDFEVLKEEVEVVRI